MTAQMYESLLYKGKKFGMAAVPLNDYLCTRNDIKFVYPHTACWRGYLGSWEIEDKKLFLVSLTAFLEGRETMDLNSLFPNQEKVFADWFSGEIRIPIGEELLYVHMGYGSIYERDLILEFKDGVMISEKEVDNQEKVKEYEKQEQEFLARFN